MKKNPQSFRESLKDLFSGERKSSSDNNSLAAEQLEPRILYSAAPVEAPPEASGDDAPVQVQTAAPVAAPAAAPVAEVASAAAPEVAITPAAEGVTQSVALPAAAGKSEVSPTQDVVLANLDASTAELNKQAVETLAAEARQRWIDSGISAEQIAALDSVSYHIADVGGAHLGVANGFSIIIDDDAGGTGAGNWFIDGTPDADEEFIGSGMGDSTMLTAFSGSQASARFDLLSTLIHEQGHVLGLADEFGAQRNNVMDSLLDSGTRRMPVTGQAEGAIVGSVAGDNFLTAHIVRASTNSAGGEANGLSERPSISDDGRYVAFSSYATDLVAGDTNGQNDIFVKDLHSGEVTRVSTDSTGGQSNSASYVPVISGDGRYVAFQSYASNLVAGDTNAVPDIFVKDLKTGELTRVSTDSAGGQGNRDSYFVSISENGRYLAFASHADNLVAGDTNAQSDIFVKDMRNGKLTWISTNSSGVQGNGFSEAPSISANGRLISFSSLASNLVEGDTNSFNDIFVKDRVNGKISRVSTSGTGVESDGGSFNPSISADGRYLAFNSNATNLVTGDTNGEEDIFVKNLKTGEIMRVSTATNGNEASGESRFASLSGDGRFVSFRSSASDLLVSGDTNGVDDIFVKDTVGGELVRVSTNSSAEQGNSASFFSSISADGRFVAFDSGATNLVAGDTNSSHDVFVKGLSTFIDSYTTSVEFDASGNLLITDIDGADTDDKLFVGFDRDGRLEISDSRATVGTSIIGATTVGSRGRGVSIDLAPHIASGSFTGQIIVDTLGGDDRVTIGDLSSLPGGLMVYGGLGQDEIVQDGVVTLTGGADLEYRAEEIRLDRGSALENDTGRIDLLANIGGTGIGKSTGIYSNGAMLKSNSGVIELTGHGGDKSSANRGVYLKKTVIDSGGNVKIDGTGGGTTSGNTGVLLSSGTVISAANRLEIFGTGGEGTSSNIGVQMTGTTLTTTGTATLDIDGRGMGSRSGNEGLKIASSTIRAEGTGAIEIAGWASTTATGSSNRGATFSSSTIVAEGNNLYVDGTGGSGSNTNTGLRATRTTFESTTADANIHGIAQSTTTGSSNRGTYFTSKNVLNAGGTAFLVGFGGGGKNSNAALTVTSSTVTAGGDFLIDAFAQGSTTGSLNRGMDFSNTDIHAGSFGALGDGGGGTSNNSGVRIKGGMITTTTGSADLTGSAKTSTSGANNFGVEISRTPLDAANGVSINGIGGGGTSGNFGVDLSAPTVAGGAGNVLISGLAHDTTSKANNRGTRVLNTVISGANVSLNGTAGTGTSGNEGTHVSGGSIDATGNVVINGDTQVGATSSGNRGVYLNRLAVNAVDHIVVDGRGGDGVSSNYGSYLNRAQLTSSGSFVDLLGIAKASTSGASNIGLYLADSEIDGTASQITATGGGGTDNNRGFEMKGGSIVNRDFTLNLTITANALASTTGTGNNGGKVVGATLDAQGPVFFNTTGGGGSSNNTSLSVSRGTLVSHTATLVLTGDANTGTTKNKNLGIDLSATSVMSSANLTFIGNGGGGRDYNEGVRIVGGSVVSTGGTTNITGTAHGSATGRGNTGIFIYNRVNIGDFGMNINGTGGGGTGSNHGVYMHRNITTVGSTSINGVAGAGASSEDRAGDYFVI